MHATGTALAAAAAITAGIIGAAPAAADPPPPTPTPILIDCGPYGEASKALEAAREHMSPPLDDGLPPDPNLRVDSTPTRCK